MATGDLYDVLGLEPGASREQIERAYRFNLELYGEGSLAVYSLIEPAEAEAERSRIREAHAVLIDPERRRAYDEGLGYAPPEGQPLPLSTPAGAAGGEPAAALPKVLTGADLRRIREARGISLRHIANASKIGMRFLEYIEEDRFAFLPASVYLRGFLQEYARIVGLDPGGVAEAYMRRLSGA